VRKKQKQNIYCTAYFFCLRAIKCIICYKQTGKVVITEEVTTRGSGGRAEPPAAGGKRGFGGGAPMLTIILQFFSQKYAFLSIYFGQNFCLKRVFK